MKISFIAITACACCCFWQGPVAAQADWNIPSSDSLAISLNNLKHSAEQLRQYNVWLRGEIETLEAKIQGRQPATPTAQRPDAIGRYAPLKPVGQDTMALPAVPSAAHMQSVGEEQRLLAEIAVVEKEIQELMAALQNGESDPGQFGSPLTDPDHEAKSRLTQANIKQLQKQLDDLSRHNAGALKGYNQVQDKNFALNKNKASLIADLQQAENEFDQLKAQYDKLDAEQGKLIQESQASLDELQAESRRLESVLKKVDMRMTSTQRKLEITDQEIETLMENRQFIKVENGSLKEKFFRVQEDWKEVQESAKK